MRRSQEMDPLMNISTAISDRVIHEIQSIMGSLSSGQRDTESGTSTNNQNISEKMNGLNAKLKKGF